MDETRTMKVGTVAAGLTVRTLHQLGQHWPALAE
jgi:hypothetical protein